MNERDRVGRFIAAEATHAIVATLSVRLDAQLAAWQRAMQSESETAGTSHKVKPRSAADVLWDLQAVANDLDLRIDVLRREVAIESGQERHARAAALMESEVAELEAVRDAYRRAIAAVQASLDG